MEKFTNIIKTITNVKLDEWQDGGSDIAMSPEQAEFISEDSNENGKYEKILSKYLDDTKVTVKSINKISTGHKIVKAETEDGPMTFGLDKNDRVMTTSSDHSKNENIEDESFTSHEDQRKRDWEHSGLCPKCKGEVEENNGGYICPECGWKFDSGRSITESFFNKKSFEDINYITFGERED